MRQLLASTLIRLASWLGSKSGPPPTGPWRDASFLDAYRRQRQPTPTELLAELKGTAWTCASINAAVCASFPPKLYVATRPGEAPPRCLTRRLPGPRERQLRDRSDLAIRLKDVQQIEEVAEHPLLTLLQQVNDQHNSFDLWELTQFYLEVQGSAYWYLEMDSALDIPRNIWILPAQSVRPRRGADSPNLVDYYEYTTAERRVRYRPEEIIHFRFPDPRDPYTSGLSPLRACFEQAALTSDYAALKRSVYDNTGVPSVVLSPAEVMGEEERDRLEEAWNHKFRRGGAGKVLVSESGLKVDILSHSMGDLAALADMKATREEIANAFHVPLPFLSADTNLANMQAADHLHKTVAIFPRLRRRDEKLNEQLLPLYDPTGRLFVTSEDPTPTAQEYLRKLLEIDLRYGVRTVNEVRAERGLPPVPWGDKPWPVPTPSTGQDHSSGGSN